MNLRLRTSLVCAAAAVALVATVTASATASPPRDGSDPLPGYTIANPPLEPLTVGGEKTRVLQGVRKHAAYDLEIPPHWNGELVMWAHGYRGQGAVLTVDPPDYGLRKTFVEQGYAWAASSYYANGYDVRAGVRSTRDLARYAATKLRKQPRRTYLAGVSMGGHVIGRSLEEYPRFYDGALPMCGVLGDVKLFDFFLDYNLAAQTLARHPAYPFPADYLTQDVPAIQSELGLDGLTPTGPDTTNKRGNQLREVTINRSGGTRPADEAAFAFWKDFLFTLGTPDTGGTLAENPGRVAQNARTTYRPDEPVDLNATITRVRAGDQRPRDTGKLTAVPRILGEPRVPVLSLHGLGDMFVPFSMEQQYRQKTARRGSSDLVVQRAIRTVNHCEFSPAEAGAAWNDLRTWVHAKGAKARRDARPAGDDVRSPGVVADPRYGCRFTDPSAYGTGTRGLFARCRP